MKKYSHTALEQKWQKKWTTSKVYKTKDVGKKKAYVLDMFPYPSGDGLHVGHPKGYIATDIYARMRRMQGYSVLHPMGWDAFGLPAENFAIKNKIHPRKAVEKNIKRFKQQLSMIGLDYDWSREINTTDPAYYKWTQWIFLQLFQKGLAYQSYEPINWCPSCQTGLANEDLEDGKCERCGTVVEKKPMRQWVLKITDYAERLLTDLELLPQWQEHIKESQRNWIGKSEGAEIPFSIEFEHGQKPGSIPVFTTRADTLFGATYLALSPEHLWVTLACDDAHKGVLNNQDAVRAYVADAKKKTEIERTAEGKEKTGVKLEGVWAVNPATEEKIPVFVADYVLPHYGTGAVMGVPAHDERDWDFAQKYGIPIRQVIRPVFKPEEKKDTSVQRNTISAFVTNKKGEVLLLKWKQYNWLTGVVGGVESGETPMNAAVREVLEETGYKAKVIFTSPITIESHYFADHKNEWRSRTDVPVLLELEDETPSPISEEESSKHSLQWVKKEDALKMEMFKNNKLALELALGVLTAYGDKKYDETPTLINSGEYSGITSEEAKKKIAQKYGTIKTTYKLRDWVFSRQRYWGEPIPVIHCEKCGVVPVPEKDLPVKLPDVKKYEPTGTGESPLAAIEKWVNVKCPKCKGKAKRETNTMPQWAGSSWYYLRYMDPKNKREIVNKKLERKWDPVDLYVGGAEHATRHLIYVRFWHKFLYDIKAVSTKEPFTRLISVGLIQAEDGRKMSKRFGNVINPDDIVKLYGADTLRVYEMFMGPFTDAIAWNTNSMIGSRRFLERIWKIQERVVVKDNPALNAMLHKTLKKVGEDIEGFKFNTAISEMMKLVNEMSGEVGLAQWTSFVKILAPFAPHMAEELWSGARQKGSVHLAQWPKYNPKHLVQDTVTIVVQVNGKPRGTVQMPTGSEEAEIRGQTEPLIEKWLEEKRVVRFVYVKDRIANYVLA